MTVKGNHPLSEIIAKKLFGISSVPTKEQNKMVNRACKSAVEWLQSQPPKCVYYNQGTCDECGKTCSRCSELNKKN